MVAFFVRRQGNSERGPATICLKNFNVAVVFFYDTITDTQPQTDSLPQFFGCIKGFEQFCGVYSFYTRTIIDDTDFNKLFTIIINPVTRRNFNDTT